MFATSCQLHPVKRAFLALIVAFLFVQLPGRPVDANNAIPSKIEAHSATSNLRLAAEEVYQLTLRGTALVVVYDRQGQLKGFGTAWITNLDQGLLITNHHVVDDVSRVEIYFPQFEQGELLTDLQDYQYVKPAVATIVDSDRSLDLATLRVTDIPANARALDLAAKSARPASAVHTIGGKPQGSTGLFSYRQRHGTTSTELGHQYLRKPDSNNRNQS